MNAQLRRSAIEYPLSRRLRVEDIPVEGVSGTLTANEQERAALATALDLEEMGPMRLDYELARIGRERFRLSGNLHTEVTQSCVVTLEPVRCAIDEHIEIEFWPAEDVEALETRAEQDGTLVPLDGPEPLEGGVIDVGQIAYEHLAAAIDPYPRKPGVSFEWQDPRSSGEEESGNKPFANLKNLLKRKSGQSQ